MSLSPRLTTLLEAAESEAKRLGHQESTVLHLAAALAASDRKEFERVFGEGASAALRKRLRGGRPSTQGAATFLNAVGSEDVARILVALRDSPDVDLRPSTGHADSDTARAGGSAATDSVSSDDGDGDAPAPRASAGGLLEHVSPDPRIRDRDSVVAELIVLLGRQVPATPLLVGPAGGGSTAVTVALATRLADAQYVGPLAGKDVVRVSVSELLSRNPASALSRALDSVAGDSVVVVDDVEVITAMGSGGAILPMLMRLRAAVEDPGARLVLVVEEKFASRLEAADEELAAEVTHVSVPPLTVGQLERIARERASELGSHHGVQLDETVLLRAVEPPGPNVQRSHPGLLIDRLDTACARAALRHDRVVVAEDLGIVPSGSSSPGGGPDLVARLKERVQGQDLAIERVSARVALTQAHMDLRPDRPDGVFLFVGPTGVGKTELARALCVELFGDVERLVRLDMSEYAHDWALSRLMGPQPGFVGYTEPDGWLTTRIRRRPQTVLLLDEIEKAHPTVWNAFLQVFDAGRLTDARGDVADFSHAVVVMTSNLGAHAFSTPRLGFVRANEERAVAVEEDERVIETIRGVMAPELINRLDDVVVFRPLGRAAIRAIADKEVAAALEQLAQRGYRVEVPEEVVHLLSESGYDPAYGARHLHRNIERLLLQPLAASGTRDAVAFVSDGTVRIRQA